MIVHLLVLICTSVQMNNEKSIRYSSCRVIVLTASIFK